MAPRMQRVNLSGTRVLVVEDVYVIADDLQHELEHAGAEVVGPVPTLDAAMKLVTAGPGIDGAVLDVELNGQKVFPLAAELSNRGVPFVFVTGYDQSMIPAEHSHVPRYEKPADAMKIARALFPKRLAG
ncbi:MAG TPA: hypothetical protein VHL31_13140 [Geminicoccus sp.]|uniref:hypothetical protein n=1 Tax=Geminicoccus sp. TaxID=2024832 RepID=UPI002E2F51C3|nr:hypothetical protein [Geminicoccus sp.]HEX2527226.1 hypothetical protein [Geminicoccus sp.]